MLPASGGADYFPPGTKLSYYFEVRDKEGSVARTEEREFVYEDNRFHWLTVSDDLITVYYYSEYVEERARSILEAARVTMDNMVDVLGIVPTEPLANRYLQQLPAHGDGPPVPVPGGIGGPAGPGHGVFRRTGCS